MEPLDKNFENKLKAHTENFVMYPSQKVWAGISEGLNLKTRMPYQKRYAVISLMVVGIIAANFLTHNSFFNNNISAANNNVALNNVPKNGASENIYKNVNTIKKFKISKITAVKSNNTNFINSILALNKYKVVVAYNKPYINNNEVINKVKEINNLYYNKINPNKINNLEAANDGKNLVIENNILPTKNLTDKKIAIIDLNKNKFETSNKNIVEIVEVNEIKQGTIANNKLIKPLLNTQLNNKAAKAVFKKQEERYKTLNVYLTPLMGTVSIKNKAAYGNLGFVEKYNNLKPKVGVAFGMQAQYFRGKISYLIGGQINVYGDKFTAYKSASPERVMVSSTLNINTYRFDSSFSKYRSVGAAENSVQLSNTFINFSVPIGVNYKFAEIGKRINFNISGLIAPSVMIYADNYALSGDLKNYIKAPQEVRKYNISGVVFTYAEFKHKNMSWQIGPQFNYQLLNTYKNNFHIQSISKDIGFRIGMLKRF